MSKYKLEEKTYQQIIPAGQVSDISLLGKSVQATVQDGFLLNRTELVQLLTECRLSGAKTIHDFLKQKGIKYK